jgi:hypothetical protein
MSGSSGHACGIEVIPKNCYDSLIRQSFPDLYSFKFYCLCAFP